MERRFIKERQREGIQQPKAAGVYTGGRPRLDRDRIGFFSASGAGPAAIAKVAGRSRMQACRVLQEP